MPVDTVGKSSRSAFPSCGKEPSTDTTSCALLLGTKVDLSAGGDPPFQTSLHCILLVYSLHPVSTRCQRRGSGLVGELAKIVEHPDANHAVLRAVAVLRAPATRVVLQAEHDIAWGRRGTSQLQLPGIGAWIGNGGDKGL